MANTETLFWLLEESADIDTVTVLVFCYHLHFNTGELLLGFTVVSQNIGVLSVVTFRMNPSSCVDALYSKRPLS